MKPLRLVAGIKAAIEDPEFVQKAADAGLRLVYMTPEEEEELSASLVAAAKENLK